MILHDISIGSFLNVRKDRIKPIEANKLGLKRIEKIDFSGSYHLSNKTTNTDMILVKKGDLLISGINAEKGAITVYQETDDALATIHYSSYEFDENFIDINYFRWFLKSSIFKNLLKATAGNGIKTELKPKHILPLKIDLPDILLQRQIICEIETKFKLLSLIQGEQESQLTILKQLRQSILQEAIQGKLVPQDPKDEPASKLLEYLKANKEVLNKKKKIVLEPIKDVPYKIPKNWAWCRLDELSNIGTGATPLTSNTDYYKGNIAWITSSATGDPFVLKAEKYISQQAIDETNCTIYPKGTLVVAMYGQGKTRGQITELCIDAATNQACAAITLLFEKDFHRTYVKLFFQKIYHEIRELAAGGAQPNLNLQKIKCTLIPLPPAAEQKRIVTKVKELMQLCNELEKQINQNKEDAAQLLQAVLREAFESKQKYETEETLAVAAEPDVKIITS